MNSSFVRRVFRFICRVLDYKYSVWKAKRDVEQRWIYRKKGKNHTLPAQLIVSLTSYPARFKSLHLTIKCLLTQTVAPDKVILWLAHQDRTELTEEILCLENEGLQILFCDDIKSYKKIIPTLHLEPEAFVVTADDDLYYTESWLEELTVSYAGDNKEVICHRAHKIMMDDTCSLLPYIEWEMETKSNEASSLIFPTSGAGALYPPNVFHPYVLADEIFMDGCPRADDVWLYWMVRLSNGKARKVGASWKLIEWPGTQSNALWTKNVLDGGNDLQIEYMLKRFGLPITE